jgi:hypothetical protein
MPEARAIGSRMREIRFVEGRAGRASLLLYRLRKML